MLDRSLRLNPTLDCTSDRDPLSYRAGEPMVFSFRASNAPAGARIRWRRTGDDGRAESLLDWIPSPVASIVT